nr:uncharacterized protein LOC121115618 isoform X2 [Lepeophtheirus salmonis]
MLKQRRLIDDAVLSVWSKLTDNLSLPPPRSSQTSKRRERLQLENELLETMELDIFLEENVQTAQELYKKVEATEDKGLEIEDKLTFKGFQGHHKISNSVVSHYLCSKLRDKIKSVTEVINIAAYLGSKEQLRTMKSS